MEVVIAISILAISIAMLMALLSAGMKSGKDSRQTLALALIARQIQTRLLVDENWPLPASTPISAQPAQAFTTSFFFDAEGRATTQQEAVYHAQLTIQSPSSMPYFSKRLDSVLLSVNTTAQPQKVIARIPLQRAHLTPRPWSP